MMQRWVGHLVNLKTALKKAQVQDLLLLRSSFTAWLSLGLSFSLT